MRAVLVLTTAPDLKMARRLARGLVDQKLAACVSIRGGFESLYCWRGKIEKSAEAIILIKTSRERYKALEKAIRKIHPYKTPEIIMFPVSGGFADYLEWMRTSLK